MIRRDSYYFKEGKLELSILDEEIDDQKDDNFYIQIGKSSSKSPDQIQNNLDKNIESKELEELNLAARSKALEDVVLEAADVPMKCGVRDKENANGGFDTAAEIKISEEVINTLKTMGEFLTQSEAPGEELPRPQNAMLEESSSQTDEEVIELNQSKEDEAARFNNYFYNEISLQQGSIDALLFSHFGEVKPRFKYAEELRQKIENQIKRIKS